MLKKLQKDIDKEKIDTKIETVDEAKNKSQKKED